MIKSQNTENTITIRSNGDVVPCCYDLTSKLVMGNIRENSLAQIWNGDISIEELKELFIGPSIITIFYSKRENIELNVKYSDGIFVDRIDKNKLSINWLWIEGTFIQNDCQLEMPIEVDSVEKFIELYPF